MIILSLYFSSNIASFLNSLSRCRQIVIGLQDTVIDPWQSLAELKGQLKNRQPAEIHLINTMAHSYPIGIFEKEVAYFMQKIDD